MTNLRRWKIPESFYDVFESPIGPLYLIITKKKLSGIKFKNPEVILQRGKAPQLIKRELREYFEKGLEKFSQKIILIEGTDFDKKVWLALREIPFGEIRTYKWLAEKVGKPTAFRAVGQSLSRNPIPIVLPCHRIIESDGSIGGYSGGIDIKRRLLDIEYYLSQGKMQYSIDVGLAN